MSSRRIVTYASPGRPRRGRRRQTVALATATALCGVVAAIAWASAASTSRPRAVTQPRAVARPTRSAAVLTAVEALYRLTVSALTDRARFERAVRSVAAPSAASHVRRSFGATDPTLLAAFAQRPAVLRGAPLGYRVTSFSPRAASVAIWNVAIAGTRRYGVQVQWRTLTIDVVWVKDRWQVVGGSGRAGPAPSAPLAHLTTSAAAFTPLRYAP